MNSTFLELVNPYFNDINYYKYINYYTKYIEYYQLDGFISCIPQFIIIYMLGHIIGYRLGTKSSKFTGKETDEETDSETTEDETEDETTEDETDSETEDETVVAELDDETDTDSENYIENGIIVDSCIPSAPNGWSGPFYGFYLWKEKELKEFIDIVHYADFYEAVKVVNDIEKTIISKWPNSCLGITKDKVNSKYPYRIRLGLGGTPIYLKNSSSWLYSWVKGNCKLEDTKDVTESITSTNTNSNKWARIEKDNNTIYKFTRLN